MILIIVVMLGVGLSTCLIAVAVIPKFDRRTPLSRLHAMVPTGPRAATSRSS